MQKYITISIILIFSLFASCKKDSSFSKDHLNFSADTVLFDTVFTTIGSTTKKFKIYNYNAFKIDVEEIELMGGSSSPFRINVDGVSGTVHENIEIPGNDSLFVFVEVTLQVNNATNPLVISDSIRFRTNGVNQYVHLDVWGQDAYFHSNEVVSGVWANDKPHVLYGDVAVGYPGIDSSLNLIIPQGTDIFCHKNSRLIVYKSSLDIQGTLGNEVTFQGDRLESFYDDVTGQWWGILMVEAQTSNINYAIIKNGSVALQVDSTMDPLTLNLSNTIIDNSNFFNLDVNAGAIINANNCLFGKSGIASAYLFAGGEYHFNHCDFVNYWTGSRGGPAIAIVNWWEFEGSIFCRDIINTSNFTNCVAYGNSDKEWVVDTLNCGGTIIDFEVWNSVLKNDEPYESIEYSNYYDIIWNQDPLFTDPGGVDFHLEPGSSCQGVGIATALSIDIEGNAYASPPAAGCYKY